MRYSVGFKSPTTRCIFVDRNPGFVPIVDSDTICVALCDNKEIAERIVLLLNAHEPTRRGP